MKNLSSILTLVALSATVISARAFPVRSDDGPFALYGRSPHKPKKNGAGAAAAIGASPGASSALSNSTIAAVAASNSTAPAGEKKQKANKATKAPGPAQQAGDASTAASNDAASAGLASAGVPATEAADSPAGANGIDIAAIINSLTGGVVRRHHAGKGGKAAADPVAASAPDAAAATETANICARSLEERHHQGETITPPGPGHAAATKAPTAGGACA